MAYWLYITNPQNGEVTIKNNLLGAAERHINTVAKVNKGDRILIYEVGDLGEKKARIVGEFEAESEMFKERTEVFHQTTKTPNEIFPLRIKLRPLNMFPTPVEVVPLVPELSFITNKRHWAGPIRGKVLVEIPKNDHDLIVSKAV